MTAPLPLVKRMKSTDNKTTVLFVAKHRAYSIPSSNVPTLGANNSTARIGSVKLS